MGNYETVVGNLHKNGIAIQGYFMFGFDNDTSKYHILALDNKEYISPDLGVEDILNEIKAQGGIFRGLV